jgi:hypothetical protein
MHHIGASLDAFAGNTTLATGGSRVVGGLWSFENLDRAMSRTSPKGPAKPRRSRKLTTSFAH